MTSVCLYFKVHQPYRLQQYQVKGTGLNFSYEDEVADASSIHYLADHCYLPANTVMQELMEQYGDRFRVSFSISGTAIELFQKHRPDVLESFGKLAATGQVEILAETYYHSFAFLYSRQEFRRQVKKHRAAIQQLFGQTPRVFRNTELVFNNQLVPEIANLGLDGILCEGVQKILQGRSPNLVYASPATDSVRLFLRNAPLSDDIALRFDDYNWDRYPLTAEKFAEWLHVHPANTEVINLMLDYETFGVHKNPGSGIFDFLRALPAAILHRDDFRLSTPSQIQSGPEREMYDVPLTISWEEGPGRWFEDMRQNNTLKKIYSLENLVMNGGHQPTIETWGKLQAADYFYYMTEESTKAAAYRYHNPFSTPAEAFQNYGNLLADFEIGLIEKEISRRKKSFTRSSFINSFL